MKDTHLIQRLEQPYKGADKNPFTFGGGYRNGGLSDDAFSQLNRVFAFEYMGAAEYEFGAIPEALRAMARVPLTGFEFKIDHVVKPGHFLQRDLDKAGEQPNTNPTVFYVICAKDDTLEVQKRIELLVVDKLHVRDQTNVKEAMAAFDTSLIRTRAWLELDNGFFFTVDKDMFEKLSIICGVGKDGGAV